MFQTYPKKDPQIDNRIVFFLTIQIVEQVYVQALGFTQMFYRFAFAESREAAIALGEGFCQAHGLTVRRITLSRSLQQSLDLYVFPEQILRDRPLAQVWRGEVVVNPSNIEHLLDLGATCEAHLREHVYQFVAPEAVAMRINDGSTIDCIGQMKPWVASSAEAQRRAVATAP